MKSRTVSLIGLICILFAMPALAQAQSDQARNYQIDATHTGSVTSPGLTPPLKQKWSVNFGQRISYPLIADGRVFVTVRNPSAFGTMLYALDGATGANIWSFPLGGTYWWSALCYENGRVFAVNTDGLLRAFDGATGNLIWTRQLNAYAVSAPPTVFQGVIYQGGSGTIFAVSADTGDLLWTASVTNGDASSPAVTADGLYVSYACPNVYKLNPANGTLIWRTPVGCSGGGGQTPVLYNGLLYTRDLDGSIYDSQTGTIIGSFNAKNAPVFSGNMGFFLNGPHTYSAPGTLEGRDLSNNNALVWSFAGDGFLLSGLLVVNDYVYVGSSQGKLYALEASTGQMVWSGTAGASIPYPNTQDPSQPLPGLAAGEGLLVVPTTTTLVAYEADYTPPSITWSSPVPVANASGWNTSSVNLPFTLSGVGSVTPQSPLHFTSEGANQTQQLSLTDRAGNITTVTSPVVNIDLSAPTTSAVISGGAGSNDWYSSVQVTLSVSDNLSGVANTFYGLDGGPAQTYGSAFSLSSNGAHTVSYWSVDVAGNTESSHSSVVQIDTSAPSTQFSTSGTTGGNGWYKSAVQVSLSASDNNQAGVANTYYSVDGGPTQSYAGSFAIGTEGVHSVNFWSVDRLGNTETQHTTAVKIDWTSSTVQYALSGVTGPLGFFKGPVQVSLTASDNLSGLSSVYSRVDSGWAIPYTGSFAISSDGIHQLEFWSMDMASNPAVQYSITIKIDTTAPLTQVAFSGTAGTNGWYRGTVQVSISATDNVAGVNTINYMIDNGTTKLYTAPFNYSSNGSHTISYWSIDKVLNSETVRVLPIKIDTTKPNATVSASPASAPPSSNPVTVTVTGHVTDTHSGVQLSSVVYSVVDEYGVTQPSGPVVLQANGNYSFTLSLPATKNAGDSSHVYTITVQASDQAGNTDSASDTVKIN